MLLSWNALQTPLEGVTDAQLEAVFGAPEAITVEAGTTFTLQAEAPRTAYLVVSGALHLAPELRAFIPKARDLELQIRDLELQIRALALA